MIPAGWQHGRVIDFIELQRGFDLTERESIPGCVPVYSSSGIAYYHNVPKVKAPGVVTGRKGSVGKVFYVDEDYWPHDTTLWVKNFNHNDPEYVRYFLEYLRLERYDEASSVPTLNRNNVHGLKCIFPKIIEQRRIIEQIKVWESSINLTDRLIAAKQERRTWLMQQLLTGKHRAPGFAMKWTTRSMKELVEPIQRRIPKPVEAYKALGIRSHCKGTFERIINDPEAVDMDELYVAKAGDLIVNITFAWEGAIAFVPEEHDGNLVSHRFPTYRLKESIVDPEFMRYLVTLPRFRFNLVLISPGGAGRNRVMSKRDFLEIEVAVPCLEEQRQIGRMLKLADEEIVLLSQQLDALREQKKGLMQQLLTGKIRVKV